MPFRPSRKRLRTDTPPQSLRSTQYILLTIKGPSCQRFLDKNSKFCLFLQRIRRIFGILRRGPPPVSRGPGPPPLFSAACDPPDILFAGRKFFQLSERQSLPPCIYFWRIYVHSAQFFLDFPCRFCTASVSVPLAFCKKRLRRAARTGAPHGRRYLPTMISRISSSVRRMPSRARRPTLPMVFSTPFWMMPSPPTNWWPPLRYIW